MSKEVGFASTADVAREFKVCTQTVKQWREDHGMPYDKAGSVHIHRMPEIRAWFARYIAGNAFARRRAQERGVA